MWNIVAALVMGIAWFADVRSDLLQQVREAEGSKEVGAAVRALEEELPEGPDRWTWLGPLVEILETRGEADLAMGVLRRSADKVGDRLELHRIERLAAVQLRAGRLDDAQETAEGGLLVLDREAEEVLRRAHESDLHGLLGAIHERAGRFRAAALHYEKWVWTATCGTGSDGFRRHRDLALARCRFELGDVDEVLDSMLALVGDVEGGVGPDAADAAVAFGRYSTRAGRVEAARDLARRITGAHRDEARRLVEMGVAVEEGDTARVLELAGAGFDGKSLPAAGAHLRTAVPSAAARELTAMGASVAPAVERRIFEGDRIVMLLAVQESLPGTERGLRRRLGREDDADWGSMIRGWLEAAD